jgi:hypothetical protein
MGLIFFFLQKQDIIFIHFNFIVYIFLTYHIFYFLNDILSFFNKKKKDIFLLSEDKILEKTYISTLISLISSSRLTCLASTFY